MSYEDAVRVIKEMDEGRIQWDDNLRAQANNAIKAGGGGGGLDIPAFKFDYDQAEREALEKLRPYYEQKLAEAEGDVERAKKIIEEDYQRGNRYRAEDEATLLAADTLSREEEMRGALTNLNQRGILFGQIAPGTGESRAPYSDVAQRFTLQPLNEKQQARRMAIQRAIRRGEEVAGIEAQRGKEELDIQLPRTKRSFEEEKKRRVQTEFVPLARERALARYQEGPGATLRSYLRET